MIRYIIATNRLALVRLEGIGKIKDLDDSIQQYIVTNHPPETERAFGKMKDKHGSFFAFHGSAIENWYSILRNGIRNLSHTHMMTAGAASGAGVYSAENMNTSVGYARMSTGNSIWPYGILNNSPMGCMAIIEVIKTHDNISKGRGIYVIKNDNELIIRYLLLFNSNDLGKLNANANDLGLHHHVNRFERAYKERSAKIRKQRIDKAVKTSQEKSENTNLAKTMYEEAKIESTEEKKMKEIEENLENLEKAFAGQGSAGSNRRILHEYKNLVKSDGCSGITVEFEHGSNIYVWLIHVNVDQFEITPLLRNDFEAYANRYARNKEIDFEVRFDSNFPFTPPFIRVIRPRFKFHTGHVTIGGSICMQSLTASGWIPVRSIESIILEILCNMLEGGARLDPSQPHKDYKLTEAKEAFARVARDHKWL